MAKLDLTYTENVVHAMWLATTVDNLPSGEVFNITNGDPMILRDMIKAIFAPLPVTCQIASLPYELLDVAARAMEIRATLLGGEPPFTRYSIGALNFDMTLDIEKAKRLLGYRPVVSIADGIHLTVRWIQSHGNDYGL
jgi:nucleoside-diphosphate-sugar epimerase